jgi:hypothetical protein
MAETVDDFIQRFGGSGTVDDQQAMQYHDKFVSTDPADKSFDNQAYHQGATEYLGKLPDDEFQQTAKSAYEKVEPQQQQGLIGSLLGALQGRGVGLGSLAGMLGLGSTNPQQMGADDYAKVANYARREQPEAMQQAVAEKPFLLKAMGNPIVMGALGMVAARMLRNRR